jgi:hypothetical protein
MLDDPILGIGYIGTYSIVVQVLDEINSTSEARRHRSTSGLPLCS